MDLFRPDAPWSTAASSLQAFKISTQFGLRSTDDQLRTLINDLQRRHIGLAVELAVLVGTDRCGKTVEGYASPKAADPDKASVERAGLRKARKDGAAARLCIEPMRRESKGTRMIRISAVNRSFMKQMLTILMRLCFCLALAGPAFGQEIWLSPNGPTDHYAELLRSADLWPDAAKSVKVFKISTQFAIFASDAEFAAFIEGTKRLNFKIAMEGLMLTGGDHCGHQVEGYTGPAAILRAAQRIQKSGAKLSYIAMDSVLIFGHEYAGPNACQDSIQSLAQQVAEKVAQAKSVFPDIQVGDIEPIGNPRPDWLKDIADWTKAYESATGMPLAFFDFDVDWSNPRWPQELQAGVRLMDSLHIPIAITYNGSKRETSSRAWVEQAVEHFRRIEGELKIHPRFAVIQSWNRYPEKMVPEANPETLSYVVREYGRAAKRN